MPSNMGIILSCLNEAFLLIFDTFFFHFIFILAIQCLRKQHRLKIILLKTNFFIFNPCCLIKMILVATKKKNDIYN